MAITIAPRGLLLIEEVEWIHTSQAVFQTYLDIVAQLLTAQKSDLYLGPILAHLPDPARGQKHTSQIARLPICNYQAATMFYMNIQTWKHHPFIQTTYDKAMLEDLEDTLRYLAKTEDKTSQIEWGMRQIAFQVTK